MKIDLGIRRALALFLVGMFALISNLIFFGREAKHYSSPYLDEELAFYDPWNELDKYRRRFEKLRVELNPTQVAGYISDTVSFTHFAFTQYVLAPVILVPNQNHPVVIGNFKRGIIPPEVSTNAQLRVVSDLGDGTVLFRSRTR